MNEFDIKKIVHEELKKCGIRIPVEETFDYSGLEEPDKCKKFVKLTSGIWRWAIYVQKNGERYGDKQYFDLLFVVDEKGEPVCMPVPIARKLFNEEIKPDYCIHVMPGYIYEYIYKAYYEERELPF